VTRRPILAANWKMHKRRAEAESFARDLVKRLGSDSATSLRSQDVEVVIAPPFPWLGAVSAQLAGSAIGCAAQNVHPEPQGAFTGEVSPAMLVDAGCRYAIVGHSERRALFGETDAFIARKVAALQRADLTPILCVGETLSEREAGQTEAVLARQLEGSLAELDVSQAARLVLAYEPVWAIGTGRTATPEIAQQAHAFLRERLTARLGSVAGAIRIQYGGSVKPDNVSVLMAEPDIDGALVGGASLEAASFATIVRYQEKPK